MAISLTFLVQQSLTGVIVVAYLAYEIRWGRGQVAFDQLNGVTIVLLAVVEELDGVDENRAKDRLNGEQPDDYIVDGVKTDGGEVDDGHN